MTPHILRSAEEATPAWLTEALRAAGALPGGRSVSAVSMRANAAFNSSVTHLALTYDGPVPAATSQAVLLKLNAEENGELEVAFYRAVHALGLQSRLPMIALCYVADYDATGGDSQLLLRDVSATHTAPIARQRLLAGDSVPEEELLAPIVEALARLHAVWWEQPQLAAGNMGLCRVRWWYGNAEEHRQLVTRREHEWSSFQDMLGDSLSDDLRTLYSSALAALPRLWQWYLEPRITAFHNLTLTNGDCYFTQFLCHREHSAVGKSTEVYLVDFQAASGNFGAYDLVYLLATFWTPEQRHAGEREEQLLRRYHEMLLANGVTGYTWEQLLTDYRLMVAYMVFDPVWDAVSGADESYWRPKLHCLTANYQDLKCVELAG